MGLFNKFKIQLSVLAVSAFIGMLGASQSFAAQAPRKILPGRIPPQTRQAMQPLAPRGPASTREISEAIDITGQSRNLSMGLMFQRDKDKVSFGSPRTNYKDKITTRQTNY